MSKNKNTVSVSQKKQEREMMKKKKLKAVLIASASVLAVAIIILLAIFVVRPAIEKKKAEDENQQTTAPVPETEEEYGEYMGCRMPSEFSSLLNQSDTDSENACKKYGVAAEIGGHNLSVPEYAMYYYRAESDQFMKAATSVSEKGQNLTGFEPSIAPSKQNYPQTETKWSQKLNERIETEIECDFFLFDKAIEEGFIPPQETFDAISELFEYLSLAANGYSSLDDYVSEKYAEGLTFAMFARREIIIDFAEAYSNSLIDSKAESYSEDFVDDIFRKSPEKYKNVTVNILPIENPDNVDEAKKAKDFSGFCSFAKKQVSSSEFDPDKQTESYQVTYDDIADYYGSTVSDWIFSSERKVGDTGVVKGAIYNCLVHIKQLPEITHSSDVLVLKIDSDSSKTVDDAFSEAEGVYKELGGEKMTEEKFRDYLSGNSSYYEYTEFVNTFESSVDKWIHSEERKYGDTLCFKGSSSAYVVMFLKDNTEDTYPNAVIRRTSAEEEIQNYIADNSYSLSAKEKGMNKSIEIAEEKYLAFYEKNKDKVGE